MKEIIGTISPYERRKEGHREHITGTGAHIDKKRYTRKVKHKRRSNNGETTTHI